MTMQITDDMVERALAAVRHDDYGLGNNCIPFYTKATEWWMRGEPNHKFDNVESAKQYAVHKQMRAALEAALNHAGDGPGPSTLAADRLPSPSASGRGQPAPEKIEAILRETLYEAAAAVIEECARAVPTNWCDQLLSGKDATKLPLDCLGVEKLLRGIQDRIRALADKGTQR